MKKKANNREHKLNREITHRQVRLVGDNVETGVYSIEEAQSLADSEEMDLVMINESSNPPICKIFQYDKFLYEKSKVKQPKTLPVKEMRISLNIGEHDLNIKTKQINEFLSKGHKVKVSLQLKGREMAYQDKAMGVMLKLTLNVSEKGLAEALPKLEGKRMFLNLKPKSN
jgi:translation initiation factor IF-3